MCSLGFLAAWGQCDQVVGCLCVTQALLYWKTLCTPLSTHDDPKATQILSECIERSLILMHSIRFQAACG